VNSLTPIVEVLVDTIGPIGAILACVSLFLGYLVWWDRRNAKDDQAIPPDYQALLAQHREDMSRHHGELAKMNERYHEAIGDNTKILERLAVIFEERTRPRT
jgi:hypothetical protein